MTITRSATFFAVLLATLTLSSLTANAAMNDSGLGTRAGYARPSPMPAKLAMPAGFSIPANLMALGLGLSAPETVAAIPSEPLSVDSGETDVVDDVIGANN
jgi:hypothetical protein